MEFLYKRNKNGEISVEIILNPVSERGFSYARLVKQKAFIKLLNDYYLPTNFNGYNSCYDMNYIPCNEGIAFHFCKEPGNFQNDIEDFIRRIYERVQAKVREAISDYEKITKMLELVKKEEEVCK